jgi:predicted Zn-dependent protease
MVKKRVQRAVQQIGVALLAGTLGAGGLQAQTREGVQVGETSVFAKIVPADQIEREANLQYQQTLAQASKQHALGPSDSAQVLRLRAIMDRIIPFTGQWNRRAQQWKWEVNLIGSNQINAYCMPGGKIAFYSGILDKLQLTDDEVAMVMGHEIAHALREHARERMGKGRATDFAARVGGSLAASLFGIDPRITDAVAQTGASLATLKFGREDESEADLVGMELAARAGYDPRAGVSLWQKMAANNKGAPPEWLSTHPSGNSRIAEIEANLPKVTPLYDRAKKPAASEASSQ